MPDATNQDKHTAQPKYYYQGTQVTPGNSWTNSDGLDVIEIRLPDGSWWTVAANLVLEVK